MQIQRIQNNNYNTQFNGKLTLIDDTLMSNGKILLSASDKELFNSEIRRYQMRDLGFYKRDIIPFFSYMHKTTSKAVDKELYDSAVRLLGKNNIENPDIDIVNVNKRNLFDFWGYINILLGIDSRQIKFDPSKEQYRFFSRYSDKENKKLTYCIQLNDRYSVIHELNTNDINNTNSMTVK